MKYRPSSFLMLALASGVFLQACSTARKNKEAGNSSLLNGIVLAQPLSRSEIDSLKEIADLPTSMLPSSAGQIQSESAQNADRQRDAESSNLLTADSGWEELGADPKEVNPGDVFSENEGALLEKSFSLADGLTASERRSLLNQFTMISTARVPVTLSRREINQLQNDAGEGLELPTRSVALDFRSENRTVANGRIETLFDLIGRGEPVESIGSNERIKLLKKQCSDVKKRLSDGERLYIITSVSESESLSASYPGAPLGAKDI